MVGEGGRRSGHAPDREAGGPDPVPGPPDDPAGPASQYVLIFQSGNPGEVMVPDDELAVAGERDCRDHLVEISDWLAVSPELGSECPEDPAGLVCDGEFDQGPDDGFDFPNVLLRRCREAGSAPAMPRNRWSSGTSSRPNCSCRCDGDAAFLGGTRYTNQQPFFTSTVNISLFFPAQCLDRDDR